MFFVLEQILTHGLLAWISDVFLYTVRLIQLLAILMTQVITYKILNRKCFVILNPYELTKTV